MAFVELDGLTKRFGDLEAVRDVSLAVERGQVMAILGPSGSGKTTLLRIVAGFETPDAGRVLAGGEEVTGLKPAARRFGMVFQHYALFPHLDVLGNVAFGLLAQGEPKERAHARVAEVLRLVDLAGFEARRIAELSGGQQQRVALARALAPEPRVLLLDEPLSNLDPALRERTRRELRSVIDRVGITTLFVTHDQEEAFDLGDRVAVMSPGRIEQVDAPDRLYAEPASLFVATFVGRANVVPGRLEAAPGSERGGGAARVRVGPVTWEASIVGAAGAGAAVTVVLRPEWLAFVDAGAPGAVEGTVRHRRFTGAAAFFTVDTAAAGALEVMADPGSAREGERVAVAPRRPALAFR